MKPSKPLDNSLLQDIFYPDWIKKGIDVSVLRDDLVHRYMSGNKWRKLKYNLEDFRRSGKEFVLTFGGAFSNHLVATAAASKEFSFKSIGIVRGEEVENPYLAFAKKQGMILHYVSRETYRQKNEAATVLNMLEELKAKNIIRHFEDVFIIPEGGANRAAVRGASEIIEDIGRDFNWVTVACGTGATLAGISQKLSGIQMALGIPVLKGSGYLNKEIEKLGGVHERIKLNEDYHFGGYAKKTDQLDKFCKNFTSATKIPLEPIYTGKLFFAIDDLINSGYFKKGEKVTAIHTGGIFEFDD